MRKIMILAFVTLIVPIVQAFAYEKTYEETSLIRAAEEISTSGMDDDEKIERLTAIRLRVGELRKRAETVGKIADAPPPIATVPENVRPLSTLVQKQAREAAHPTSGTAEEERGPSFMVRAAFILKRIVGWSIILGVAAAVLFWGYVLFLGFCEKSGQSDWAAFAFRQRARLRKFEIGRNAEAANPVNIARDGMVPERLR